MGALCGWGAEKWGLRWDWAFSGVQETMGMFSCFLRLRSAVLDPFPVPLRLDTKSCLLSGLFTLSPTPAQLIAGLGEKD